MFRCCLVNDLTQTAILDFMLLASMALVMSMYLTLLVVRMAQFG